MIKLLYWYLVYRILSSLTRFQTTHKPYSVAESTVWMQYLSSSSFFPPLIPRKNQSPGCAIPAVLQSVLLHLHLRERESSTAYSLTGVAHCMRCMNMSLPELSLSVPTHLANRCSVGSESRVTVISFCPITLRGNRLEGWVVWRMNIGQLFGSFYYL